MSAYIKLALPAFALVLFAVYCVMYRYYHKRHRVREERQIIYLQRNRPNPGPGHPIRSPRRHSESSQSRTLAEAPASHLPDATLNPPPEYEPAIRSSIAVIYMDDDPPPTYEEYQMTQKKLGNNPMTQDVPIYTLLNTPDLNKKQFRPDGDILLPSYI